MPPEDSRWQREMDIFRVDVQRDFDRLDSRVDKCITESFYLKAQEQNGERVTALREEMTLLKTAREADKQERQRDRQQMKVVIVGAGLTLLGSVGLEILRAVSGAP